MLRVGGGRRSLGEWDTRAVGDGEQGRRTAQAARRAVEIRTEAGDVSPARTARSRSRSRRLADGCRKGALESAPK